MYEECDKSTLTPEQLRKVVKTRWVVDDQPDPTTTTTTGEVHASEQKAMHGLRTSPKLCQQHLGKYYANKIYDNARQTDAKAMSLRRGLNPGPSVYEMLCH